MACSGNSQQICGGANANSIYKINTQIVSAQPMPIVYLGCYTDSSTRVLPYICNDGTNNYPMTNDWCASCCYAYGYQYAGTE